MMEEDRRAAVLAAADVVCFADRQGDDVWLAAAQLDCALLELCSALRRRRRFESQQFELLRVTTPSLPSSCPGTSTSAAPGIGGGGDDDDG